MWQVNNNARTTTEVSSSGTVTSKAVQAAKQYALGTNYKVWAIKDVLLRSAPDASSVQGGMLTQIKFAWDEGNYITAPKSNILELCKARGVPLYDLPVEYLAWFARKDCFPQGRLGELLRIVHQMKVDGLDEVFDELRRKAGGKTPLRTPNRRGNAHFD